MFKIYLVGFIVGFVYTTNVESVSFIKPCKADDKQCIINSVQAALPAFAKGLPEYGIPPLIPIFIKSGKLDYSNLNIKYSDVSVYALEGMKIVDVERDINAGTIKIVSEFPLRIIGQYIVDGKVLFLDILGNGDLEIKSEKVRLNLILKTKNIDGVDGQKHLHVKSVDYTYDLLKKVDIKLNNLFGGDEQKAKPINEVLKNSWREVIDDIGGPIIKVFIDELANYIEKFFVAVPLKDLEIA